MIGVIMGARRFWAAAAVVGSLGIVLLLTIVAVDRMTIAPSMQTADTYAALNEARHTRQDIRPAPTVTSVLQEGGTPAADSPTADEEPAAFRAPPSRIRIPSIEVDADIVPLGIRPDGQMEDPDRADLVGWYDFTGNPGAGGNAVLSGHVDYRGQGPAVFWDLRELEEGDTVEVLLTDETRVSYRVTSSLDAPVEDLRMDTILASTSEESLTLITCSGAFVDGSYPNRLIVRAVRTSASQE